jgi:hypothetical protein
MPEILNVARISSDDVGEPLGFGLGRGTFHTDQKRRSQNATCADLRIGDACGFSTPRDYIARGSTASASKAGSVTSDAHTYCLPKTLRK